MVLATKKGFAALLSSKLHGETRKISPTGVMSNENLNKEYCKKKIKIQISPANENLNKEYC
jgi:hypothetical protein